MVSEHVCVLVPTPHTPPAFNPPVTCAPPVLAGRRFPQRWWERIEAARQRHCPRRGNSDPSGQNSNALRSAMARPIRGVEGAKMPRSRQGEVGETFGLGLEKTPWKA